MLGKLINQAGNLAIDLAVRDAEAKKAIKMGWAAAAAITEAATGSPAGAVVVGLDIAQTAIDDPTTNQVVGVAKSVVDTAVTGGVQAAQQAAATAASSAPSILSASVNAGLEQIAGVGIGAAAGGVAAAASGDTSWIQEGASLGQGMYRDGDWRAALQSVASAAGGAVAGAALTHDQSEAVQREAVRFGMRNGLRVGQGAQAAEDGKWEPATVDAASLTAGAIATAGTDGPRERIARMQATTSSLRGAVSVGRGIGWPSDRAGPNSREDHLLSGLRAVGSVGGRAVATVGELTAGLEAARHADAAVGERDDQLGKRDRSSAIRNAQLRHHKEARRAHRVGLVSELIDTASELTVESLRRGRSRVPGAPPPTT